MTDTIVLNGVEGLIQKLNDLPLKAEVKLMRGTVKDMTDQMVAELKTRVFVAAQHIKRGSLRTNKKGVQYSTYFPQNLRDSISASGVTKSKTSLKASIKSNFYAKFLEFGSYGHEGYHPFVRPTMDTKAPSITQSALDHLLLRLGELA